MYNTYTETSQKTQKRKPVPTQHLWIKIFPLAFLELMTTGKHIYGHLQTLLCVCQRSLAPCCSQSVKHVCVKNNNLTTPGIF